MIDDRTLFVILVPLGMCIIGCMLAMGKRMTEDPKDALKNVRRPYMSKSDDQDEDDD